MKVNASHLRAISAIPLMSKHKPTSSSSKITGEPPAKKIAGILTHPLTAFAKLHL